MQIGDYVVVKKEYNMFDYGVNNDGTLIGKIVSINGRYRNSNNNDYGIEFINDMGGHNCNGRAKYRHGWYIKPRFLVKIGTNLK